MLRNNIEIIILSVKQIPQIVSFKKSDLSEIIQQWPVANSQLNSYLNSFFPKYNNIYFVNFQVNKN
jgi:hypothetical protein